MAGLHVALLTKMRNDGPQRGIGEPQRSTALGRPFLAARKLRFQLLLRLRGHIPVRRQDIVLCCPSWCTPARDKPWFHLGVPAVRGALKGSNSKA